MQGKTYFTCPDNHGIFVRQSQITAIDDGGAPPATPAAAAKPSSLPTPTPSPGLPTPSQQQQRSMKKSGLRPPSYAGKSMIYFIILKVALPFSKLQSITFLAYIC